MSESVITPEQQQLKELVREFVERVVTPVAADLDRNPDPEDSFSWEIVEQASKIGIRTLTLEREYGGAEVDSVTAAIAIEELGKGDLGVSVIMAQTLKLIQLYQGACTEDQKKRWLPKIAEDDRCLLAIGLTEPDNASNYFIPFDTAFRTTAVKTDGGWVINGLKHFISNGNRSRVYAVLAQTDKDQPMRKGSTFFILERGTEGFTTGKVHNKMGERLANNSELIFKDCFVPDEDVLGEVNGGFDVLRWFIPWSNFYAAASVLGVAAAAYESALTWARERVQGGKPIIEHDTIGKQLAEMRMLCDVARAYIHQVAWAADHREQAWDPVMSAFPKVFASEAAWRVTRSCLEIHGAYGFMKELGVEKLIRDSAAFLHSDGVNNTVLLKAARFIRDGDTGKTGATISS